MRPASLFQSFFVSVTVVSSPSTYLSPTARWQVFTETHAAEDGSLCNWLPPSSGRMQSPAAEARLRQWFEQCKGHVREDREQHPVFHELLRLSLPASAGAADPSQGRNQCVPLHVEGVGRIVHCINTGYLSGSSPDFSLFSKGYSRSVAACAFNIELQLGELDPDHKFRALDYNARVMTANPSRSFTLTAVTNLNKIMFVRTSREMEGSNDFVEQYSVDYDVLDLGWELLLSVIRDARWTGQFLPQLVCDGQQVDIVKYLGAGVCSRVWEGQIQPSSGSATPAHWRQPIKIVCKTFVDEQLFTAELRIWEEIARRRNSTSSSSAGNTPTQLIYYSNYLPPNSPPAQRSHSLPSRLPSSSSSSASPSAIGAASSPPTRSVLSPYCLFFTPVGIRPVGAASRSREFIEDMFSCVAGLRRLGIVHRDLTPRHFLRSNSDAHSASHGLFLIDFGFSQPLPLDRDDCGDLLVEFCGSTYFAPTSLLHQLAALPRTTFSSSPFTYSPQLAHDLESLVKVCFACANPDRVEDLRRLDNKDAKGIAAFWDRVEAWMSKAQPLWKNAMDRARVDEWEAAKSAVEGNFTHAAQ